MSKKSEGRSKKLKCGYADLFMKIKIEINNRLTMFQIWTQMGDVPLRGL